MNGIMEKIRQLMAGRYGNDFLNAVLFIFGAVISVVCSLFRIPFGSLKLCPLRNCSLQNAVKRLH